MESIRDLILDIAINADTSPIVETQRRLRELQRQIGGYEDTQIRANDRIIRSNRNVINEMEVVNRQFGRQSDVIRRLAQTSGQSAQRMANNWNNMSAEMRRSLVRNHNNLIRYQRDLMGVENQMLTLSDQMGHYTGTTNDFMREVQQLGAEHKKISDQMINSNIALRATYVQQAAAAMNLSTTSSKINKVYEQSGNVLYQMNRPLLAVTDSMERLARNGNPVVIALRQLGPNASMKELQDRINLINTGIMRQQELLMVVGVAWLGFTAILANAAMGPDVEENLKAQAQAWTDYKQTLATRTQEIANTFSLFSQVQLQATSPRRLFLNLEQQLKVMETWQGNLKRLVMRGVDEGLIAELRKMGPSAAAEVAALVRMSDPGLNRYVEMWREKHRLARVAAMTELEKLKQQTKQKVQKLKDALKPLGVAVEGFKSTWSDAFAPFVDFWGLLASYVVRAGTKIGEFVQKLNEINPWITKLAGMFMYLFSTFMVLFSPLAIGIGLLGGLSAAFAAIWAIIGQVVIGFAAVAGIAAVVSLAVIGTAAAIYLLWTRSETFRNTVISGWESIKQAALSVWGFIRPYIMQAIVAVVSFGQQKLAQLRQFWQENGSQILQAVKNIWTPISFVIKTVMNAIWAVMKFVWPAVLLLIKSVWGNIKGVINGGLQVILGVVKFFSSLFTGNFRGMWEATKQIFFGAIQFIWNFVQLTLFGKILGAGKVFILSFRSGFAALWAAIRSIFVGGITAVRNFFVGGFTWLRNFSNNIVHNMTTGIVQRFLNMVNQARTIFSLLRQWGENIFRALWNTIRSVVTNIVIGVRTGFTTMKNKAVELVNSMKTAVTNRFTAIVDAARALPRRIGDAIKGMAKHAMSGVKALGGTLVKGLEDVINKITQDGVNKLLIKLGVTDTKYHIPKLDIPGYAHGTKGHKGGPAVLGDGRGSNAGPELYRTPKGQIGLSPATDTLMNLPKGTQVLSATNTRKVLSSMPHYDQGNTTVGGFMSQIGNSIKDKAATAHQATKNVAGNVKDFAFDVWQYVSDPSKLMEKALGKFNLNLPDISGTFGHIASASISKVKDGAVGYIKRKIDELGLLFGDGDGWTGEMEKDPRAVGRGSGLGGMMRYVEYWYNQVKSRFGPTRFMGGFSNRGVVGNSKVKSMHAYGRAFDIGGSHKTMNAIAEYLRQSASNLQYVIYNRKIAGPGVGKSWRRYNGLNPHTDHVHADFLPTGGGGGGIPGGKISGNLAAWIRAGMARAGVSGANWMNGLNWIIQKESSGRPNAQGAMTSDGRAKGLMQLKHFNYKGDPFDPVNNIFWGIKYIQGRYKSIEGALSWWRKHNWYKNGTRSHQGGPAVLGDGGKHELFRTPRGIMGLSPAVPTWMNLPRGSQVLSGNKTEQAFKNASSEDVYTPTIETAAASGSGKNVTIHYNPTVTITVPGGGEVPASVKAEFEKMLEDHYRKLQTLIIDPEGV